jgi:hypothetical protein
MITFDIAPEHMAFAGLAMFAIAAAFAAWKLGRRS